ncbi:hypothetical protein HK104_003482 [Borealophlyctis nickersoniae]|nr:hypothetical protein HK104_003482 [Borealophlyctis nickersoniae]
MSMVNIVVRNGANVKLAAIYVGTGGAHLGISDALVYLGILTDKTPQELGEDYVLQRGQRPSPSPPPVTHLTAGHYVLYPKDTATPQLQPRPEPQIPTLFRRKVKSPKEKKNSTNADELAGALALLSTKEDEIDDEEEDDDQVLPEEVARYSRFTLSLSLRDRRCIVSGVADPDDLEGGHIIPHSWKRAKGVDDIQNGALMMGPIHRAFDRQYWSVVWDDGVKKWRVVAMDKKCPPEIVGNFLLTPDAGIGEDGVSYEDVFVNPRFLRFHLETAVFRRMRGGAEEEDLADKPMREIVKVWGDEQAFAQYVQTGGAPRVACSDGFYHRDL